MPHSIDVHKEILKSAQANSNSEKPVLVVFDLDSTLYNVTPRSQKILDDCMEESEFQSLFPTEYSFLKNVKVDHYDWGIRESVIRSQIKASLDFFEYIRDYWKKYFFSSDYLHLDKPYEGAVEYANSISQAGAEVIYLTGRHHSTMLKGTIESLKNCQFPFIDEQSSLILKAHEFRNDEHYKFEALESLAKKYDEIWFFDNEPVIVNYIKENLPQIKVVFIDSIHSGKADAKEDLPRIKGFFKLFHP